MPRIAPQLYDADPRNAMSQDVLFFLKKIKNNDKVLEIGIGTGRLAFRLAENGCFVHGIDPDHSMLAQLIYKLMGLPICHLDKLKIEACGLFEFKGQPDSYDAVVFAYRTYAAFLKWEDQVLALRKSLELTKDGGSVWITLPAEFEKPSKSWEGNHTKDWEIIGENGTILERLSEREFFDLDNRIHHINLKYRLTYNSLSQLEISEPIKVAHISHEHFTDLCKEVNAKIVNCFGDYDESEFGNGPEMIYQVQPLS